MGDEKRMRFEGFVSMSILRLGAGDDGEYAACGEEGEYAACGDDGEYAACGEEGEYAA